MFQELIFHLKVLTEHIFCEIGSGGTNFTPEQIFCYISIIVVVYFVYVNQPGITISILFSQL
jgi:hypothetical protein